MTDAIRSDVAPTRIGWGGFGFLGVLGLAANSDDRVAGPDAKSGRGKRASRAPDAHVANALRSAYEEAVREDVPSEFLDLLGKLA